MLELIAAAQGTEAESEVHRGEGCEAFFAKRLSAFAPTQFVEAEVYRSDAEVGAFGRERERTVAFGAVVEPLLRLYPGQAIEDILLAIVATYLFRTSGDGTHCLALAASREEPASAGKQDAMVPLLVQVSPSAPFAAVLEVVRAERARSAAFRPVAFAALSRIVATGGASEAWALPLPLLVSVTDGPPGRSIDRAATHLWFDATRRTLGMRFPGSLSGEFGTVVVDHLCQLARTIAARPEAPVADLEYLAEAERHRILVGWNDTAVDFAHAGGLIEQFERQVAADPEHAAVIYQGRSLSYAAFNARVNQLAHHLRRSGVGADTFVAICLDRSVEMVVAIWAILKAGGAYVPLNVEDPPQRLAAIIGNAGARVILTEAKFVDKLPKTRTQLVVLSPDGAEVARESAANPDPVIKGGDIAYMIYTSGSTGEPKGVLIEHAAITNRIVWMQNEYRLTPEDRVLQKTPYTFDVSVWEFLWPLAVGAGLVVAEPGGHVVPSYLSRLIQQERVTCLHFVPSVLRLFLACPPPQDCPLRMVFCSGEALSHELQEQFFVRYDAALHNLYGPTEAAVDVTYWQCDRRKHRGRVPIGKPIANIRMHILDERLRPVPPGVAGDLYIGGVGLARGYWNKPELTAQRFIDDPLGLGGPVGIGSSGKLYLTGDVARYLPDGNIEYLGRNDHQVKVNGIRIELGEIESVMRLHPGVADAVVITDKGDGGNPQLLGFLVPKAEGAGGAALDHLREFLEQRLPPHMIPRRLNPIGHIPLTVSGKVDRKALAQLTVAA